MLLQCKFMTFQPDKWSIFWKLVCKTEKMEPLDPQMILSYFPIWIDLLNWQRPWISVDAFTHNRRRLRYKVKISSPVAGVFFEIKSTSGDLPRHLHALKKLWVAAYFLFHTRKFCASNKYIGFFAYFIKSLSARGLPYWMQSGRGGHFAWPSRKCIPQQKWVHLIVMLGLNCAALVR